MLVGTFNSSLSEYLQVWKFGLKFQITGRKRKLRKEAKRKENANPSKKGR